MKTLYKALSVVLLLTAGAMCQQPVTGTLAASGQTVVMNLNQNTGAAVISVTGTFSLTGTVEASNDGGTTYNTLTATDGSTTSFSAAGGAQWNVTGYQAIRVRCSAYTSGTMVVTITAGTQAARSGGGGGGSGNVSGQANGVIPLATASTTIGAQSHLDDGVSTAGTITSTEPIQISGGSAAGGMFFKNGTAPSPTTQANSFGFYAPSSIATGYSLIWPNAAPTSGHTFLSCTAANPSTCTWAAGGSGLAFPVTVSGTTNSGGIPYFSNTTTLTSSSTLTQYGAMYGGGTGAAPGVVTPPATNGFYFLGHNVTGSAAVAPTATASTALPAGTAIGTSDTGSPAMTFSANTIALTATNFSVSGISSSTSPICPNGTGGAFTTSGCSGGGGGGGFSQPISNQSTAYNVQSSDFSTSTTFGTLLTNTDTSPNTFTLLGSSLPANGACVGVQNPVTSGLSDHQSQ